MQSNPAIVKDPPAFQNGAWVLTSRKNGGTGNKKETGFSTAETRFLDS
jgi:hypothetical protein